MAIRKLACVGDLHVGSDLALWTDAPNVRRNRRKKPNAAQKMLLRYWESFWRDASDCDTIILLGDLCDGNNRKEAGRNLTTVELEEQMETCFHLLDRHTKGKKVWGIGGSGYHQSIEMDLDRLVTERLGGTYAGAILNLRLKGTGLLLQARHGGSSAVMYRGGNMDMESMLLDAAQGSKSIDFGVDILLRGHWHWYSMLQNRSRTIVQVPGWKLLFPYRGCERYGKVIPDIGGVLLTLREGSVLVDKRLYPYIPVIDEVRSDE